MKVSIGTYEQGRPLCVFGVLDNEKGLEIEAEMAAWLSPNYNLVTVHHDGSMFERPAIQVASELMRNSEKAGHTCLYIHTKGAWNDNVFQSPIRRLWEKEFTPPRMDIYTTMTKTSEPLVAAPYIGDDRQTWYNAWFANKAAWEVIGDVPISTDRYFYEALWRDYPVKMQGVLDSGLSSYRVMRSMLSRVKTFE